MIDDTELQLRAQIAADPDDPAQYLVYADWLSGSADPIAQAHGALAVVQHRLSSAPDDPELRTEEARLCERLVHPLLLGRDDDLVWRWGFIHHVTFTDRGPSTMWRILSLVEQMLALPAARFLHRLDVFGYDVYELEGIVARLGAVRPATLRQLAICEQVPYSHRIVDRIVLENVSALWSLALDRLRLRASRIVLGTIDAPTLRRIEFEGGLQAEALAALARARWPRLETFSATQDHDPFERYGEEVTFDGDALCSVLATSAWAEQLVELDLTRCAITDEGARLLPRLPRVENIDLSRNQLGEAVLGELRARWPALVYHA